MYEYSLGQAIEDGYLAACEIVQSEIDLDQTGLAIEDIMALNPMDATTGEPLTEDQIRESVEETIEELVEQGLVRECSENLGP